MSQHIFEQTVHGQHYEVQIGWDKPLQCYYGMIVGWVEDNDCEERGYFDHLIWSNLYDGGQYYRLEAIAQEITRRGFQIPEGLLFNVTQDQRNNTVNKMVFYDCPSSLHFATTVTPPCL